MNALDPQYYEARREHAFLLRCEGLTLREIGERLGITKQTAQVHVMAFGRRLNHAVRKAHASVQRS